MVVIGTVLVAGSLLLVGWLLYRQLTTPTVQNPVLATIRVDDENYDRMTPAQIDAQLERQIGVGTTHLKSHDITKGTLKTHKNAWRAAKALRSVQAYDKSLDAYAVGAQLADKTVGYQYFYDYGMNAESNGEHVVAVTQLTEAKRRLEATSTSTESTNETLAFMKRHIAINQLQAERR
jgi:hypothetical protein